VGVLIEAARVLARSKDRARTIVFASFDGREGVLDAPGGLGARAYVQALRKEGRPVVGALVLDRAGRKGLPPVLETTAYPDPLRRGSPLLAPAPLVRAALLGSRNAGEPPAVGHPAWSWLYQAGVRSFRLTDRGDDRVFLEAGFPALRVSSRRSLSADPKDLLSADTAEHLDADSLAAVGRVVLATVAVLQSAGKPEPAEVDWFAHFGQVSGRNTLLAAGAASLVPGLLLAFRGGRLRLGFWLAQAAAFFVLLYREPVVAVFALALWNVLAAFGPRLLGLVVGALPAAALLAFGGLGFVRGYVDGVHLSVVELVLLFLAAALALAAGRLRGASGRSSRGGRRRGLKGR
jgi:hypothetical protein